MPRLGQDVRNQAVGMHMSGMSNSEIARRVGCHNSTVFCLVRRYLDTGAVIDRQRSGIPPVTSHRQDVNIRVKHLRNRFITASKTAKRDYRHTGAV